MVVLLVSCAVVTPAAAQDWDSAPLDSLVDRAVRRRSQVDSALRAWTATANGELTFLVELGDGAVLPPRVVKLEQLATLIHWETPGNSEQRIVGRRDTMLFPGDVGFYSDRYGVITNNLGDRVRLGDGHDVRDLPHPLSPGGRAEYQFALADSLVLSVPGRRVEVYELLLRPRVEGRAAMVGSIYLDRATGDLVRLAVTFTRAAILDARIERLGLVLENLLVEGQWWLPYTQQLEVVRAATWFDFPTRGIVRGRWTVSGHVVVSDPSVPLPPPLPRTGRVLVNLPGQRIGLAPPVERERYEWSAPLDSVVAAGDPLTDADISGVERQAERIVEGRALERVQRASIGGNGISDFFHVNRVEGAAIGLAGRLRPAAGWAVDGRIGYGFSDDVVKARLEVSRRIGGDLIAGAYGERIYRDAGDVREVSGVRNSISAPLFGDDNTDPYEVQGGGAWVRWQVQPALRWQNTVSLERQRAVGVHATPLGGQYAPTIDARALDALRFETTIEQALRPAPLSTRAAWRLSGRLSWSDPLDGGHEALTARLAGSLLVEVPAGGTRVHLETHGALAGGDAVPPQELVRLGGIITGPGYSYHEFAGTVAISQRAEWRVPVPFVSLPLPGYGRSPARATVSPYGHVTCVGGRQVPGESDPSEGCFPSLGIGFSAIYDLLRLDLAYGLREGVWHFGVDLGRVLWGLL